jgi:hypothetical protein
MISTWDTPLDAREVGGELFGRPCRLTLALWIVRHDKPRFYQSEPPREVILQGDAGKELGRLVYYERTDSPLWKIIQAAAEVIEDN